MPAKRTLAPDEYELIRSLAARGASHRDRRGHPGRERAHVGSRRRSQERQSTSEMEP